MIMLYRVLVASVLEFGSVCDSGIARTHMLRLERVQNRGIRIALGLMCSTPNNILAVLSGIAPLAESFGYSFCGRSHERGTFRGSDIYVFGGGSPRAIDDDS
jgi:hypothetical protein